MEEHDIDEILGTEIYSQFLVLNSNPVLVVVHIEVVIIPETVLNPQREGIKNKIVLHPNFGLENVFHHLVNDVCFYKFEDTVVQIHRLLPH